jgi:hypothetical protein
MRRKAIPPTGRESPLDVAEIIVSRTDPKGRITYADAVFQRVSGRTERPAAGVDPFNATRTAMDGTTQQNTAPIEERTAAARSLEEQAQSLTAAMAGFTIAPKVAAPASGRPPARPASPAAQVHAAVA